ncbi:MAG TPA: PQQ-dependent dehydrogenase, methanol/ethanol family [Vicinamibacterales bacterium]|nr:PQQ-dependent dehydrogenase, methanol/ethanol family [Vicinamibacterales bacterium]
MPIRVAAVVLGTSVVAGGIVFAWQTPPQTANPFANNAAEATGGRELYGQICQSCHGPAGQGTDRGPALATTAMLHGNADADLFRSIRTGVAGTQMAGFPALGEADIWRIVTYLRTLQATRSPSTSPVIGDPTAGEALFFGAAGCSACHEVNARGGIVGPDLSGAGSLSAAVLRLKIVDPNSPAAQTTTRGSRGGAPATVTVTTSDGREIKGVRRNEDRFSLQMIDLSGQLRLLDKRALASVVIDQKSLHPADYKTQLSESAVTNLVAYLLTQKGRDIAKTSRVPPLAGGVTYERLLKSTTEPHNWLMYWGDYQGTHYSPLSSITPANVGQLRAAWSAPVPGDTVSESTPLVVDGVMYGTSGGSPRTVTAIDARTGRQIWRFVRPQKVRNPGETDVVNRGVAILGHRLFVGTNDAALLCIDARTGLLLWEIQVADTMEGFNITSPPLIVKDKIIVGHAGGEYAIRGFLDAYDVTGKHLWRFYTIPAPGEFGNDTWKGDSWKTGGGGTWLTGTYDPDLNTLYWPIGNPAAMTDRSVRGDGDNLFTDSVVALDPDTGQRKWHYQFTPNDGHDWDSTEDMVLVDRMWRGRQRKLLLHADRNGHFYVLDRTTGEFLAGTPFIHQTWNSGFDAKGRPKPIPGSNSSPEGSFLVYPTAGGATNFGAPSYSPITGLFYLEYSEAGAVYISAPQVPQKGREYLGEGPARPLPPRGPNDPAPNAGIKALDPETGKTVWDFKLFQGSLANGVLATAGGVLFASSRDGNLIALDAKTGQYLWHYQTSGNHAASPISYAINGRQYVALTAGNVLYSFALPER